MSSLLFIDRSRDVGAVEEEERRHRSVGDALVTVHERVPREQGQGPTRRLLDQSG